MPTSRPPTEAGYTLLEMLVVLIVMGMAAVIAASAMSHRPGAVERQRVAGKLRLALTAAHDVAFETGHPQRLALAALASHGVALRIDGGTDGKAGALTVYPDGSTSGGVVALDRRPLATVSWLDGAVADAR